MTAASLDNIFGDSGSAAAPAAASGPSLDNIFGGSAAPAPTTAAPKAAAPAATIANIFAAPAGSPAPDLSGKSLNIAPAKPADTSKVFSSFLTANDIKLPKPAAGSPTSSVTVPKPAALPSPAGSFQQETKAPKDTGPFKTPIDSYVAPKNIGEVSEGLTHAINDPLNKISDLLSNSVALQKWTQDADTNQGKAAALGLLKGLSSMSGLNVVQGATGGLYKAPGLSSDDDTPKDTAADTILKTGAQLFGAVEGIGLLGEALTPAKATAILSENVAKIPLVGKYLAPYMESLLKTGVGLSTQTQLDPALGGDLKKRVETLGQSLAETPLYTALGSIKSVWASVPASFTLGYGMSRLGGADQKEALANGALFALMDGVARGSNERPILSEAEVQTNLRNEAMKTLSHFSGVKITSDMTAAELKTAYYKAVHQAHPDVGGTAEAFNAVKNSYDILSKGKAAAATEAEQSVKLLSGSVRDSIETHGEVATHQAIKEQLGLDDGSAQRLLIAAKTPRTPAEIQAAHERVTSQILGARSDDQVKADAIAHVEKNTPALIDKYISEYGNVVGADEAKELMPGYSQDRSTSDLVQKGASELTSKIYTHLLEAKQGEKNNTVLITAGGTGAGKSSALNDSGIDPKNYPVVFDSNSANAGSAKGRIEEALAKGYSVSLVYVHAPIDKAYDRVLDRTEQMAREKGSGRPVAAQGHIDMHHGAPDALLDLMEHYKGNPKVQIDIIDNSSTEAKVVKDPLDFISKVVDNKGNDHDIHESLNKQRELALQEGRISEHTNAAFERAEGLRPRKDNGGDGKKSEQEKSKADSLERGFVNPGAVAEDIANAASKVKETIDQIENTRELTGSVREGIYQHENARKAMRVRLTRMLETVGDLLDAEGWEKLYHYDENSSEPLDAREQQIYDQFVAPLKRALTDTIAKYREAGGSITPDLFFMSEGEYTPRFAKDKQSALDKLIDAGKKKLKSIKNGGSLAQSLGTVGKTRKFYAAVGKDGKRTVVYVPNDKSENVLGFKGKEISDLGPVKGVKTPKVKEFIDEPVMRKLNDLAAALGVTHERVATGKTEGLGKHVAGVSFSGENLIKTRLSPASVLAHELGHQIDHKYGMQDFMNAERFDAEHKSQLIKEMRDLADKRFEDRNAPESFKKYVRKGTEKMAVMFEAYISNRPMFKEVAPHLYDDFRQFLADHAELRPFLDIQPSISLGSETHGGEQSGKIGRKFVDKDGNEYTIEQATTKEIEENTNVEYHKNVLANYTVALDRAQNAFNAMKLLERIKNEEEFGTIIKKDSPDEPSPDGWRAIGDQLPQFRGYHMEPRVAEALTDLAGRHDYQSIPVIDSINNFLVTAILINPIMHVPNVIAGRAVAASAGDISTGSLKNMATAINEVRNKGDMYLKYLEHGAPFMHLKDVTHEFSNAVFEQYTQEVENDPSRWQEISDMLGYANPKIMTDALWKLNEDITWGSNDVFFMHALLDYADAKGGTMEDGIREVSKYMADYRMPERILLPGSAGRALSQLAQSKLFLFGRFHYTGVIRPWIEAIRDTAGPKSTAKERLQGLRVIAYMLLMGLAVWPYLNKFWQGVTGSPTTYESMPGPFKVVETGQRIEEDGAAAIPRSVQSMFTPSPALKSAIELGFNTDLFTKNPIYGGPTAEGGKYLISIISPLASASRMTGSDFALSLFGIWTPKNTPAKTELQHMKYDELPVLQSQVKKLIVSGEVDKANDEMAEYNTRAIATWNQYQLENGGKPLETDAEKQEFLKEWGIRTPGEKAIANTAALYGDGSLTNKSALLDKVVTYAKAVGVDPAAAFERIFTGQKILRVTNFGLFSDDSAIIVERMPFDASEAVKKARGATEGMVLDHVVPLEAGGSNDESNLNLIAADQNVGEQHLLENLLGDAVKQGKISQTKVREYAIRYKVGKGETLPAAYMADFKDKYGGKPMTIDDIYEAINSGKAK